MRVTNDDGSHHLSDDGSRRPGTEVSRRAVLASMAALALAACSSPSGPTVAGSSLQVPTASSDAATSDPTSAAPTTPTTTPSPSSSPSAAGPATEVTHGPRTVPAVALTFHGAGDPALAERILRSAESAGAHVTVLAVGTWLEQYPTVADRILTGGHELGNHTLHHRPMRLMDESTAYAEIIGGQRVVHRYAPTGSWFRPSGTPHATPHILAAAARAGYRTSLSFDVDPADYTDPGAALVVSRVLASVKAGSIVSLHLGHAGTIAALPKILDGLSARGLAAVTVSALLPGVSP
jgi:peptidoglycan/xylan/chitin deacetylase (PgdA/CDA1 family)